MTLEKAYKIGSKYGFTFNGVGPSLSVVDGKVGICINLLDDNFGYIKRNYSFDDADLFEEFLKKYTYYLHNRQEKDILITLDNYEDISPNIIYSNENEEVKIKEVEYRNKEFLYDDIRSFFKNFIESLEVLRADIAEKLLIEQDYYNKLDYYQKLLYKAYDSEYNESALSADKGELDNLNEEIKEFDLNNKRELSAINIEDLSYEELKQIYTDLFNKCKSFLDNEKYKESLYNKYKFRNSIVILDEMIEYLLNNPNADDTTEAKLNEIKGKDVVINMDDYINEYNEKYLSKYEGLDGDYNEHVFDAPKMEYVEYERKKYGEKKVVLDLKYLYDDLDDNAKLAVGLIHSPLKPIVLYVIEQAYLKNKKFNFEREDFKHIYNSLVEGLKNSENLVFKLKYFRNISVNSYEEFIKSIVKAAKLICTSYFELPFDLKLYSLNYDACMICASDSAIKSGSDTVNIINASAGCMFIYGPTKITYDKETGLYSTSTNNNVLYFPRYLNKSRKQKDFINLNIYDESYTIDKIKDKNLLIVDNFVLDKTVKYKFSDMVGKEKD